MKRILAPHKEQDGWRYVRVPSSIVSPLGAPRESEEVVFAARLSLTNSIAAPGLETRLELSYRDDVPCHRIISSRRVEEAVETADFLKLCAEEGLSAMLQGGYWFVGNNWSRGGYRRGHDHEAHYVYFHKTQKDDGDSDDFIPAFAGGHTLREAYYRYKAQAGDAE